ncbi:prolipoprotein diacylglyceryl transferase [Alphaproteobacteria bacterium]|nr:prolipoprotein diacylglyceryl transferase [Alphaproteobacteria bacterium]
MARRFAEKEISEQNLEDFFFWAFWGICLGGRLGHVLFFQGSYFARHPLEVLAFRDGGMSFHGGFLGVLLAAGLFTYKRKIPIPRFLDILASVAPIGLGLGRVANFVNSELYGVPTNGAFGVLFPHVPLPRHPTQLYEAFTEGVLTLLLLAGLWRVPFFQKRPGSLAALFVCSYAFWRFLIDFWKESPHYAGFTVGQILCIPMALAGGLALFRIFKKNRDPSL